MSLTDREKEQLKAMIDAGEPMPPRYRAWGGGDQMTDDDSDFPYRIPFKQCPECSGRDHIEVQATVWLRLTRTDVPFRSTIQNPRHQWDLGSPTVCGHCGYRGTLRDFHVDPPPTAIGRA
jgi:hypothetical protein